MFFSEKGSVWVRLCLRVCVCVMYVCIYVYIDQHLPNYHNNFLVRDLHRGNCSISTGYMHFEICILLCHFCLFWIFSNKIGETSPHMSALVVELGRSPVLLPTWLIVSQDQCHYPNFIIAFMNKYCTKMFKASGYSESLLKQPWVCTHNRVTSKGERLIRLPKIQRMQYILIWQFKHELIQDVLWARSLPNGCKIQNFMYCIYVSQQYNWNPLKLKCHFVLPSGLSVRSVVDLFVTNMSAHLFKKHVRKKDSWLM